MPNGDEGKGDVTIKVVADTEQVTKAMEELEREFSQADVYTEDMKESLTEDFDRMSASGEEGAEALGAAWEEIPEGFELGTQIAEEQLGELDEITLSSIADQTACFSDYGAKVGATYQGLRMGIGDLATQTSDSLKQIGGQFQATAFSIVFVSLSMIGVLWNMQSVVGFLEEPIEQVIALFENWTGTLESLITGFIFMNLAGMETESLLKALGLAVGLSEKETGHLGGTMDKTIEALMEGRAALFEIQAGMQLVFMRMVVAALPMLKKLGQAIMTFLANEEVMDVLGRLANVFVKGVILGLSHLADVIKKVNFNELAMSAAKLILVLWDLQTVLFKFVEVVLTVVHYLTLGLIPSFDGMADRFAALKPTIDESASGFENLGMVFGQLLPAFKVMTPAVSVLMGAISALVIPIVAVGTVCFTAGQIISAVTGIIGVLNSVIVYFTGVSLAQLITSVGSLAVTAFTTALTAIGSLIPGVAGLTVSVFGLDVALAPIAGIAMVITGIFIGLTIIFGDVGKAVEVLIWPFKKLYETLAALCDIVGQVGDFFGNLFGFSPGGQFQESLESAVSTAKKARQALNVEFGKISPGQIVSPGVVGGGGMVRQNIRTNINVNVESISSDMDIRKVADQINARLHRGYRRQARLV